MKRGAHFLPPRSAVVFEHTRRMLNQTSACVRKFAMQVAENYIATTAIDQRHVPFRTGATLIDLCKAERHNAQIISRYMDGTVKTLPADLEDAWLLALPDPYRSACERDLGRRRGMLPVRLLDETEASETIGLGKLAREFGELFQALAPALADGKICETDLPHARKILDESDDLIGAVLSMRRLVQAILPQGSAADA